MRSFREKTSSNRFDTRSWSLLFQTHPISTLRRHLNSEEPLTPEPANQQVNSPADERSRWAEQLNHLRQTEESEPVVLQNDLVTQ